jgi:hypoxanthine phosphoribosyltransferase
LKTIFTSEQIQARVTDMARQISADYEGGTIHAIGVMENAFIFMADLVRQLEPEVVCQFVKPVTRSTAGAHAATTEIVFVPQPEVDGRNVLLVEGIMQTGVTSEFLQRSLLAAGARVVRIATLIDRQSERRIELRPDYCGFLYTGGRVFGYGLEGDGQARRNLPCIASLER